MQKDPNGHLDLWAREHYKSTAITYGLTIQDILNDPEITVAIFSFNRVIAKKFLMQIKREFEQNEQLKSDFADILWTNPAKEAPKWSEDDGLIVRRKSNPKEPTIMASGLVDGMPTGMHFKLRVYDDVVTRESVTTPEQVKKTTEAWELSDNLGTEGGAVRYIGTRYHLRDTYATMLERNVVIPRIYPATSNGRLDGVPVLFSQDTWEQKKNTQRSTIAAQMLQNPLADADATFRCEWLKSYEVRPRTINVYIMCDPSKGRSASSDNTAISVVGLASGGSKFLLDGYCHRMTLSQRWVAIRDLYKKWSKAGGVQHIAVGYERYGAQSDDEYFQEQMDREKLWFVMDELNWTRDGTQSKRDRVERLEPDFRNSRFYLPLAVWRDNVPSVWKPVTDPDSKGFGTLEYREVTGLTNAQVVAIEGGSSDLIAKAIKRTDQDGKLYDLTLRLIEEYQTFPFGLHDDLLDATSRIYDMEARPPLIVSKELTEPTQFWDA